MLAAYSEKLYIQMEEELDRINGSSQDAFPNLMETLLCISNKLDLLKEFIRKHPFESPQHEINFFKYIKPRFYAHRIYYLEWYSLLGNIPAGDKETIRKFYRNELKAVHRFFQRVAFHYQYYRSGATELDHIYFVRGMEVHTIFVPEMPEADPEFSTSQDYLVAKFKAYEMLQQQLLCQLERLDIPAIALATSGQSLSIVSGMKWTGESINLVELAYGIWLTGQINNGNATVSEIIRWLENSLEISIGRAYRRWTEITRRDRLTTTKFLDRMRESINIRLENEDDLKRKKRQEKKNWEM